MFKAFRRPAPVLTDDPAPAPPPPPAPEPVAPPVDAAQLQALTTGASRLGYEIVDVAGFLDGLKERSRAQIDILHNAQATAEDVVASTEAASTVSAEAKDAAEEARALTDRSIETVRQSAGRSTDVAEWVSSLSEKVDTLTASLGEVDSNNKLVGEIATQVKLLSINARIEASRSGDAGKGFAIIAQEVHDMATRTNRVADHIRRSVAALNEAVAHLAGEAGTMRDKADRVIEDSEATHAALGEIAERIGGVHSKSLDMEAETSRAREATASFAPAFRDVRDSIGGTSDRIADVTKRTHTLIDTSEIIVRGTVLLGGASDDCAFIERVQDDAAALSDLLGRAVAEGRIRMEALFSRTYTPIPDTRPEQVMAPFTALTDDLFPKVQEAALAHSDKVVFCAGVNLDGYLPTHNRKFAQPQGRDEAWNTANCRNRRIFDDRVGLKAGRNTEPFLLQVYRRDMGGGTFKLMKDVSAPITVNGRHWGGLRLAYDG